MNKNKFVCNHDETKLTEPLRLQDTMEVFASDAEGGRAHLRPSGTEDFLRLYVETKNQDDIQRVADIILEEIEMRYRNHGEDKQNSACIGFFNCFMTSL